MTIEFSKWTHPKTGEVRIYLSGVYDQRGAKIWVERQQPDSFSCDWNVRIQADYARDNRPARDAANEAIEAMFGRKATFEQIAESAK